MNRSFRKTAVATALTLAIAAPASAGVFLSDALDGAYFDPAASGRGVMVDFIPAGAAGGGTFFGIAFTYAADGSPLWVTFQNESAPLEGGQSTISDMPVRLFNGGTFGDPFTGPTNTVVGTASANLNSCTNVQINLDMSTESGLADVSFNYIPLSGVASGNCQTIADLAQCPTGTTAVGNDCLLPANIEGNLFLPAGKDYIIEGQVSVVDGATLTIAPGVTLEGSENTGQPNFLAVLQGGRIYAEGTQNAPITFTGPTETAGSWAGLVLAGRAGCNEEIGGQPCQFEAVPSITYGGDVFDDNSGVLRYVRILYAGQEIAPDEELNALTMLAVGNGTTLEYIQVDNGLDDGFEWFGGTVDLRHGICSNMSDDCFDSAQGYRGRGQFLLAYQGNAASFTSDPHGIESDNTDPTSGTEPRTQPFFSNMTLVGNEQGGGGEGVRIRRGAGGNYSNMVVTGYQDRCLNLNDAETFGLATAEAQGERLSITHSFMGGCLSGTFEDAGGDPFLVSAFYAAGEGNGEGDPLLSIYLPTAESPVLVGGQAPSNPFFTPVPYRGAFSGPNDAWHRGWTVNLPE
jgi:hypothetical protein